jgi:nucleoside-diphosphate-sugar epimerase
MSIKNVVLIAGVHGVSGRAAAEHWISIPGTRVYGLSRRVAPLPPGVEAINADLFDRDDVERKLGQISGVTHIVFGAYVEKPTASERSEANLGILQNLLDVVERTSPSLQHITFYQGGKAYGADLGPFKTPAREDDPRLMPPNFYYDQEDFLRERRQRKEWHWTALRPEATTGFGLRNPMNLGMSIAVYAAISKELRLPLRFPGTEKTYGVLFQITSAEILARATTWAGQSEAGQGRDFQYHQRRLFSLEIPLAAHRRDVRHAGSRPHSNTSYRLYGRQRARVGGYCAQARLAASTLRTSFVVAFC